MVKIHVSGLADIFRQRFDSILDRVGSENFTLYSISETNNAMGRLSNRSATTSTIKGFMHKVTPQDKQFLDLGIVNIGDGVFYTNYDVSISENDEISESGETDRWILTELKENEKVQDSKAFQAWRATKRV